MTATSPSLKSGPQSLTDPYPSIEGFFLRVINTGDTLNNRVMIGGYTFVSAALNSSTVTVIGRGICKQMHRNEAETFYKELRKQNPAFVMPPVHRVERVHTNILRHK